MSTSLFVKVFEKVGGIPLCLSLYYDQIQWCFVRPMMLLLKSSLVLASICKGSPVLAPLR